MPSLNLNKRVNYLPALNTPIQPAIYAADIPTNLETNPITGDLVRIVNKNAIDLCLINICNTIMNERPYSSFGAELQLRLFENSSSIEMELISSAVSLAIKQNEPRVTVQGIQIIVSNDESYYTLTIKYIIKSNPVPLQTLSVILQRVR